MKPLNPHYQSAYVNQPWQIGDLTWGTPIQ